MTQLDRIERAITELAALLERVAADVLDIYERLEARSAFPPTTPRKESAT
jgi:hypothetical protein